MDLYIEFGTRPARRAPGKQPPPKRVLRGDDVRSKFRTIDMSSRPHTPRPHIHHFERLHPCRLQCKALARGKHFVASNHQHLHSRLSTIASWSSVCLMENCPALARAASLRARAASLFSSISFSARDNALSLFGGISRPSTRSVMSSGLPPTAVATIGVPSDITSMS